jgi:hypothetical protein
MEAELVEYEPPWEHGGKPSSFTPQLLEAICRLVGGGAKPVRAALSLGVAERTWYLWKANAKAGVQPYKERMAQIEMAEAVFLAETELCFGQAAKLDWKASKELLKSRLPREYGDKLEIARDTEAPRELSHDELRAEAEAMGLPTSIFDVDDMADEVEDDAIDVDAEAIEVE